ncbi:hypothetical protein BGZ50_008237 [Haplosporangium sp. Z 11]|nr:hypothetical protein BGZ50_008237 [Haplosporangium sp. Z 11]
MPSSTIERVTDSALKAVTSEKPVVKDDQNTMVPTLIAPFTTPFLSSAAVTLHQDDALGDVLFEDSGNINRILDQIVSNQGFAMQVDATQLDLTQLSPWMGQAQVASETLVHTSISPLQQQQDQQGYGHFDDFTMNFDATTPTNMSLLANQTSNNAADTNATNIAMVNVLAGVAGVPDQVSAATDVVKEQSLTRVTSFSVGTASPISSADLSKFHYQQWLQHIQAYLVDQEQSDTVMAEPSSTVEGLTEEQSIQLMEDIQAQYSTEHLQAVDHLPSREANHGNVLENGVDLGGQLGLGAQASSLPSFSSSPLTAEDRGEFSPANFKPSFESLLYSIAETYPLPEFVDGQIALEPQSDNFLSVQADAYDDSQGHEETPDMQLLDVKPSTSTPQGRSPQSKVSNASSNNGSDTANVSTNALDVDGEAARVQDRGKRKLVDAQDTDDDCSISHSGSSSASGSSSILGSSLSSFPSSSKTSNKQTYSSSTHPHKCTYPNCPRTFATQGLLKSHLVSHQDEKLFWCDLCAYDAVTPKPTDDPLYPGASLPQPEVKRYKRNHDLLRHKREQHPPIEVKIQREAERTAARQARKFLHRVQKEERQRAERLANASADGNRDREMAGAAKKRRKSGAEFVSASTVTTGGVGVMTAAEIHAFLYSQGSPEYNDIGICPLGTTDTSNNTRASTADANASSQPQLQISTLPTPSALLPTNAGIPTVSMFPPPLDSHQQQMQQLLQLHQLQQQQLQLQQQIRQQHQQLQNGQGLSSWAGTDSTAISTAISDVATTSGIGLLPVYHPSLLHQSSHHPQQQPPLLQPTLENTGFNPSTMSIASLPSPLVNTGMRALNLTAAPLPALPVLNDNSVSGCGVVSTPQPIPSTSSVSSSEASQQQQEHQLRHGRFSQSNNGFRVMRSMRGKTHSAEETSFHPYARGRTNGGRRIRRHGRCALL